MTAGGLSSDKMNNPMRLMSMEKSWGGQHCPSICLSDGLSLWLDGYMLY